MFLLGAALIAAAFVSGSGRALSAAQQTWPPFVLVAGLLLIGYVANDDGLFEAAAGGLERLPGGNFTLLWALLALVAAVTAVLNLDTSVTFLTPILVYVARRRGADERPFLYGCVFMSNSASLILPGSNLTNLLVLVRDPVSGSEFASRMWPAWVAAMIVTVAVVTAAYARPLAHSDGANPAAAQARLGLGLGGVLGAIALVLILPNPALWVLALGVIVAGARIATRPGLLVALCDFVNLPLLAGLFGLAVGLGTLARVWSGPSDLMAAASSWEAAAVGAVAAVAVNNLPAAVLLAAKSHAHARSLLVGLNLGPNLAVTGSLSAILWLQAARSARTRPSLATFSRIGIVLVPLSMAAALGALYLLAPGGL